MEHETQTPTPTQETRDSEGALKAALAMVHAAEQAAEAVENYHIAMRDLEKAATLRADAAARRVEALHIMKQSNYPVSTIASLTGLSTSRITALLS